mmetsp:Transcript_88613/g.194188  ORF Transcript_88613/g.194188 Transcript_88613/m.194188 type:complete len:698 (+) Transcript_88613:123-2216(+)
MSDSESDSDDGENALKSALFGLGSSAHAPQYYNIEEEEEDAAWLLCPTGRHDSLARQTGVLVHYVNNKLKAAFDFINLFPHFVDPENWYKAMIGGGDGKRSVVSRKTTVANLAQAEDDSAEVVGNSMLSGLVRELSTKLSTDTTEHQRNRILAQAREKLVEQDYHPRMYRQKLRLNEFLTEDIIHDICDCMYDSMGHNNETPDTPAITVTCVEAALMAWDLTSQMEGVWRIPLTINSKREDLKYNYVCMLIIADDCVGYLGRSCVDSMSLLPLEKRHCSDAVEHLVTEFARRGHEVESIAFGTPSTCPSRGDEARELPLVWRFLKMNFAKQSWTSIKASCDVYANLAATMRLVSLGQINDIPTGFALRRCHRKPGARRIKVVAPLLTRHRRPRLQHRRPPVLLAPAVSQKVEETTVYGGIWEAGSEDLTEARAFSPHPPPGRPSSALSSGRRTPGGGLASSSFAASRSRMMMSGLNSGSFVAGLSLGLDQTAGSSPGGNSRAGVWGPRPVSSEDRVSPTRSGVAERPSHTTRAQERGIINSMTAADMEEYDTNDLQECSSVSSATLDEWLEDWKIHRAELREVERKLEDPPRAVSPQAQEQSEADFEVHSSARFPSNGRNSADPNFSRSPSLKASSSPEKPEDQDHQSNPAESESPDTQLHETIKVIEPGDGGSMNALESGSVKAMSSSVPSREPSH